MTHCREIHTVIRPYPHTAILSYGHTLIQPYCHTAIPSYSHTVVLSYDHTHTAVSCCHTLIQSYPHTAILSYGHTLTQPCCHAAIPSHSHTVIRPYPHTAILSHGHTDIHCAFRLRVMAPADFRATDLQVGAGGRGMKNFPPQRPPTCSTEQWQRSGAGRRWSSGHGLHDRGRGVQGATGGRSLQSQLAAHRHDRLPLTPSVILQLHCTSMH